MYAMALLGVGMADGGTCLLRVQPWV